MKGIENTISSIEVAEMVGRRHDHVLRDINKIIDQLGDPKIGETYFSVDTYLDSQRKPNPCFRLSKKGCELFSTRMTGSKGTKFAVAYIERFNEMEIHIKDYEVSQLADPSTHTEALTLTHSHARTQEYV